MATDPPIALSLDAVIVAVSGDQPRILTVPRLEDEGLPGIPSGPLDPDRDPTLELALRSWVTAQTGLAIGYVEQLYTFGDIDRVRRGAGPGRLISVAYLALVREAQPSRDGAAWRDVYECFPWEDRREGVPAIVTERLAPALRAWAGDIEERRQRVAITFGLDASWDPVRVLERYELLYEAELVAEAFRDTGRPVPADLTTGTAMALDHRRIVATALGRLRGKLTYRPVVFELLPETFTLLQLQRTVEALTGVRMHKQSFRRLVERTGLVEGTGRLAPSTGGRPAELFRFRPAVLLERPRPGLAVPRTRA